jgi:urease alpha subunit
MSYRMNRRAYGETYGPTVGDRLRLADTEFSLPWSGTTPPMAMK